MIKNYFKSAWRNLVRQKENSLISIGGLSIAMTVSVLILLWAQSELRYDDDHPDADRVFMVSEFDANEKTLTETNAYAAYHSLQGQFPEIERIATAYPSKGVKQVFRVGDRKFYEESALYVDSNWTNMFHYEVIEGSLETSGPGNDQVVLSRSKAKKYFGNGSALGRTIYIDSVPAIVGAVVADLPANTSFPQDILVPNRYLFSNTYFKDYDSWNSSGHFLFVKLTPSSAPAATARKISSFFGNSRPKEDWRKDEHNFFQLIPLKALHFHNGFNGSELKHGNLTAVRIFSLLAVLLLLTASVNFVNLSIARIAERSKEMGIRKVTGANRMQLFSQMMMETALAVILSLCITIPLIFLSLPRFNIFFGQQFSFSLLDARVLLLLGGVFLLVLALTGIYPAFLMGRQGPVHLFRGNAFLNIRHEAMKKILLTGQFVLAVWMAICVFGIYRQFKFIQQQTSAYQKKQLFEFTVPVPDQMIMAGNMKAITAFHDHLLALKNELKSSSAIKEVSRVNGVSMLNNVGDREIDLTLKDHPKPGPGQKAVFLMVDEDYNKLIDIKMVSGHWFSPSTMRSQNNFIINETAVKAFGLKEPVAGTIVNDNGLGEQGQIIGVVKDFHHRNLHEKIGPLILQPQDPMMGGLNFWVEVQPGRVNDALKYAGQLWNRWYPDKPFEYSFLDEEFDKLYKDDHKALMFSLIFAGISMVVSCMGLLGMIRFSAQQRTKEIGIRKVLGASVTGIVQLLAKNYVRLVLLAIVIASPVAAWSLNKWLDNFAYRIDIQWWMFAAAGIGAVFIALATVSFQAIRAAMVNPVESLRDE